MILYADTSALIKLYIGERGTAETGQQFAAVEQIAASALAKVEVEATLSRALKAGRVSAVNLPQILARLNRDWASFYIVPITGDLLSNAAVLTWKYGLRAADSIHLASAMKVEQIVNEPITMAVFDDELWKASTQEGVTAWPHDLSIFR